MKPDWKSQQRKFFKEMFARVEIETMFPDLDTEQQDLMIKLMVDNDEFETLGEQLIKEGKFELRHSDGRPF